MIARNSWYGEVQDVLDRSNIAALVGPRQCGKTTLARQFLDEDSANYFDLEDPLSLARLDEPMTALSSLSGLIVIDEIQLKPDLFPVLRVLADRKDFGGKFLILGSASGDLLRQSSESLAGRMETITLQGLTLDELGAQAIPSLWRRGGFPRSYLAKNDTESLAWRKAFVQTLLERDFPNWGIRTSAQMLWRFWTMLAHYHGQIWNAAQLSRALGVSQATIRSYLDLLTDSFMVRQLQPYHSNIKKRQVRSPKIYIRDCGLLHQLLGITSEKDLMTHPKVGASWEGFVIEEILAKTKPDEAFFWATHQGAEVDLVIKKDGKLFGFECKRTDTPKITPSIKNAIEDINLDYVSIVYPGRKQFSLAENVEALPLATIGNQFS